MMMASVDLEQRVALLEAVVAKLKAEAGDSRGKQYPWWEEIAGSFADDPAFEEAMRLGREWRESFRPKPARKKDIDGGSRHRSPKPASNSKKAVHRKSVLRSRFGRLDPESRATTIVTYSASEPWT
jgi:hypothetical protein